jgi:hypothetical protein
MRYKSNHLIIIFMAMIAIAPGINAQETKITFRVHAPGTVEAGSAFQVVFELNREADQLEWPDFKGFEVLGGPSYGESRFTVTNNGKRSSEIKTTYTFALKALKPGTLEIGSALARIGRKSVKTAPKLITVTGTVQPEASVADPAGEGGDLFILNYITNKAPYKGEVLVLTQKLYTRLAINNLGKLKMPAFNGFWFEIIESGNYQVAQETYQGRLYNTIILSRTLLIPQRSGKITIEPTSVVIQRIVERTINRPVFGGVIQQRVRELDENVIRSSNLVIDVKEHPVANKPASFKGMTGNFSIQAQLSSDVTEVDDPLELTITIEGTGNLKMLNKIDIQMPRIIELFDPEVSGKISSTASGMSGTRQFTYLMISRDTGVFEIPGVQFSYFDPETRRYVELTTGQLRFRAVNTGKSNKYNTANMDKENVQYYGRDIRFIKLTYRSPLLSKFTPGSWIHLVLIVLPLILLILYLLHYRKQVRLYADPEKMRAMKASQVAKQRLRLAEDALKEGNEQQFFAVLLDTLWGYVADKLNIRLADLNRNSVKEELLAKKIPEGLISRYIDLIKICEYARYAPDSESFRTEKCFTDTEQCITEIEQSIQQQ